MADMQYFKHDIDARNNPPISALRGKHGIAGYGRLFCLYELIYSSGYKLDLSNPLMSDATAAQTDMTPDELYSFIEDAVAVGLFDKDMWEQSQTLTSERCARERMHVDELADQRRAAAAKSAAARAANSNARRD